jgi:hypothetical protein
VSSKATSSHSAELNTETIYLYIKNINCFKSLKMLLPFHLAKWHNITDATICSYLQRSQNVSWQAPVILSASYPFIAQHDCCTHNLIVLFLWAIPQHLNFICRHYITLHLFLLPAYTVYEDGTDRVFRNVGKYNSDAGKSPKRKNITFRTWRKF